LAETAAQERKEQPEETPPSSQSGGQAAQSELSKKTAHERRQKPSGAVRIIVVDGMGGGIGEELVRRIAAAVPNAEIIALATNAIAAERMVRAGADRGAAGENAICQSVKLGDVIVCPIGVILANSMLGEITPAMTEAVLTAPGKRIILPLQNDHVSLAGIENLPLSKMMEKAVEMVKAASNE
jgi:hypothetical protein